LSVSEIRVSGFEAGDRSRMDVVSLHPGDTRCRDGLSASSELPRRKSAGVRRRGQRFADKRMRRYSTLADPVVVDDLVSNRQNMKAVAKAGLRDCRPRPRRPCDYRIRAI